MARHIQVLDALRGVASICVVIFHMHSVGILSDVMPHGYLAVDFFFELSGLVLALAYRSKLSKTMSFSEFAIRRFVRIYPLALAGVILGTIVTICQWIKQPSTSFSLMDIISSALFNVLLLPNPFSSSSANYDIFLNDGPVWSLFFELAINIAWGAALWRLSKGTVAGLCGICALCLVVVVTVHGDANMGSSWTGFFGGLARVCFGFLLGTLINFCKWRPPLSNTLAHSAVLGLIIVIMFALPTGKTLSAPYDLLCIICIFPVVLLFGMTQHRSSSFSVFLGGISYPLYALHWPILFVARLVLRTASGHISKLLFCSAVLIICVLVSYVALNIYDIPMRRRINSILRVGGLVKPASSVREQVT